MINHAEIGLTRVSHKTALVRLAALLLVITVARSSAQLPNERPRPEPTFLTYTAEGAGGYAGALLGAAVGWFTVGLTDPWGELGLVTYGVISFPVAAVGCAGGICGLGAAFRQNGKFLPTLAYGACAAVGGSGLYYFGTLVKHGDVPAWQGNVGYGMTYVGGAIFVLAPVIATIGYNRSRPKPATGSSFLDRLDCPSVAILPGSRELAPLSLDVRLLNMRF